MVESAWQRLAGGEAQPRRKAQHSGRKAGGFPHSESGRAAIGKPLHQISVAALHGIKL